MVGGAVAWIGPKRLAVYRAIPAARVSELERLQEALRGLDERRLTEQQRVETLLRAFEVTPPERFVELRVEALSWLEPARSSVTVEVLTLERGTSLYGFEMGRRGNDDVVRSWEWGAQLEIGCAAGIEELDRAELAYGLLPGGPAPESLRAALQRRLAPLATAEATWADDHGGVTTIGLRPLKSSDEPVYFFLWTGAEMRVYAVIR